MAATKKLLWQLTAGQNALTELASRILPALRQQSPLPFCLWLEGEMGSGKTTLAGTLLHGLGLPAHIPVTSPTYSYLNEYEISGHLYAHMDLYRAEPDFALAELGPLTSQAFAGLIIEWPQHGQGSEELAATHRLVISYTDQPEERSYQFFTS